MDNRINGHDAPQGPPLLFAPDGHAAEAPDLARIVGTLAELLAGATPIGVTLRVGRNVVRLQAGRRRRRRPGPTQAPGAPAPPRPAPAPRPSVAVLNPDAREFSELQEQILLLLCAERTLTRAEIGAKLNEDPEGHLKAVLRNLKDRYWLDSSNNGWTLDVPPDTNPGDYRKALAVRLGAPVAAPPVLPRTDRPQTGAAGLRDEIRDKLEEAGRPLKAARLADLLGRSNSGHFRQTIRLMVEDGELVDLDGHFYALPGQGQTAPRSAGPRPSRSAPSTPPAPSTPGPRQLSPLSARALEVLRDKGECMAAGVAAALGLKTIAEAAAVLEDLESRGLAQQTEPGVWQAAGEPEGGAK